jgi:hypothetical protein
MKQRLLFLAVFLSFQTLAQKEDLDAKQKGFSNLTQSGKIFQVEVRPADKDLHVFITGQEAASIKLEDSVVEATLGSGPNAKKYIAQKVKDAETGRFYYRIQNAPEATAPLKLQIQSGDNKENFTFPPPK